MVLVILPDNAAAHNGASLERCSAMVHSSTEFKIRLLLLENFFFGSNSSIFNQGNGLLSQSLVELTTHSYIYEDTVYN